MTERRRIPNRRPCETLTIEAAGHVFDVSLGFRPPTITESGVVIKGELAEVFFTSRGKVGHGLDAILYDIGVNLSYAIQATDFGSEWPDLK